MAETRVVQVLIISDDADNVDMLRRLFAEIHQAIIRDTCVKSAREARKLLEENPADVLLCDINVSPEEQRLMLHSIRDLAGDYPLIILTDAHSMELEIEALRLGIQDHISKTQLGPEGLYRSIHYSMERHELRTSLGAVQDELKRTNEFLKEANSRLEIMVERDPLTELLNRRGLHRVLTREISWAHRDGSGLIVLLIDLDDFKSINDGWGHVVGDVVIKEIAGRIVHSSRVTDYHARIGGDEFLVLLPETRLAAGLRVAEKIRLAVSEPLIISQAGPVEVTVSIGAALISENVSSIDDLLVQTKVALERSKRSGKNMVSSELSAEQAQTNSNSLMLEVFDSIRSGKTMRVVKQAIFRLEDETIIGHEFLSRLDVAGFEMPNDFFRVCQEHNMLGFIDQHCFASCIREAAESSKDLCCHINIFPSTMLEVPLESFFGPIAGRREPLALCVEISEQQIIGNPLYLKKPADVLKKRGIRIAVDDVGFGRTSLESLLILEPDVIKVDMRFVRGIDEDAGKRRSLERLLNIARTLEADVVAEGIEKRSELQVLRELGVPSGQGFLWGKPA